MEHKAIPRLTALIRAGYKVNEYATKTRAHSLIWLLHPSYKRFKEWRLILYANGLVVDAPQMGAGERTWGDNQTRIEPDDDVGFDDFIARVPEPTAWERSRRSVQFVLMWAILIATLLVGIRFLAHVLK